MGIQGVAFLIVLTQCFFLSEWLGGLVAVAGPFPVLVMTVFSWLGLVHCRADSGVKMRAGGCRWLGLAQGCRTTCVSTASVDRKQSVTRADRERSSSGSISIALLSGCSNGAWADGRAVSSFPCIDQLEKGCACAITVTGGKVVSDCGIHRGVRHDAVLIISSIGWGLVCRPNGLLEMLLQCTLIFSILVRFMVVSPNCSVISEEERAVIVNPVYCNVNLIWT